MKSYPSISDLLSKGYQSVVASTIYDQLKKNSVTKMILRISRRSIAEHIRYADRQFLPLNQKTIDLYLSLSTPSQVEWIVED